MEARKRSAKPRQRAADNDANRRTHVELRLAIEHAVMRVLEESGSLAEASQQVIRVICEALGWACGARWEPEKETKAIRCAETWGIRSAGIDAFLEATRRQTPSTQLGGLNRRTWAERRPIWVQDVTKEASFRRAPEAAKAGLRSAFAFPIKVGADVIGVMEFFSAEIREPDSELLDCMTYVGSQIGQFLKRKQAEEEQQRFRAAMDASADLITLVDRETLRYVDVNTSACEVQGYSREEMLKKGPQDFSAQTREELERSYDEIIASGASTRIDSYQNRKGGGRVPVEVLRRAVRLGGRWIIVAIVRDLTERTRAEDLQKLEHSVAHSIAESESIATAMPAVIQAICKTEGWECGRYFRPDEEGRVLRLGESWGLPDAAIESYIAGSRNITYAPGVGLVGRVWESGQPLWVSDISQDARTSQAKLASASGMRGAFVFPITSGGGTIGVLAFNSREVRKSDERLLQAIRIIGSQIGQFLLRKQSEEELRRFRAAMDASADLMLLIDPVSIRYVDVNDAACRALGYSREELLKMGPSDIFSTPRETLTRLYEGMISGGLSAPTVTGHYRRKDGSQLPIEAFPRAVRTDQGHVIVSIARDLTERLAAEETLRRFRAALDTSADMIMLVDRTTMRYVDVNATACEMQGYSREEMLQMGPQDVSPVSKEVLERSYDESIASGETTRLQSYHRRKNGTQIPVEIVRRAVRTGERWIIVAIVRDITERKHDERLLTLEHAVTRNLAEADTAAGAIKAAIRAVCETQGWECGRYFRVDEKAGVLRFSEGWSIPGAGYETFIEKSHDVTYASGIGLTGLVWQSGKPVWSVDATKDPRVAQPGLARNAGTHGAFIFPVLGEGKVIGALVFSSRMVREPDERLLQAVRVIGSQVGQFLKRIEAQERMRESEDRFRGLTQLSSDMYWEQDEEFRFTSMTGIGSERVNVKTFPAIGRKRWEQNYINMTADQWAEHIALLEAHKEFRDMELCRLDESGNKVWISISGEPLLDSSGAFTGYRGVGKDITSRKLDEERIQYLANHDALTDLPNRPRFTDTLSLALQNARRYSRNFAVLFIDLDRFKVINDTLGHEAGDKLLKEVGARLAHTVRSSDVVARLGGDEFVVLVQEVDEAKQVEVVARKILTAVMKPVFIGGQECRVTASIGICMYPSEAQDEQALMKNADIAMYHAKEEGKNTFKFYSEESNVHSFERLALETSLRRGLERNEFFLHYQAKLDLHTGKITGVEALVRWRHPELGMVPPGQFIPLAEETGLIVPIGKWVLQTACHENVAWMQQGLPPIRMSVNLSARQFADENLLEDIAAALKASGMRADLLELELTESMVMQNAERAGKVLADIKEMGVRLAIDDFGVGYSSLTHLKRFPIDTLKVDRSFIRDIPQDSEDKAITEAIIAMGKSLNLTVVAEGVETLDQKTFLHEHNCDEMQGFFFSRPIPSDEFAELLRQRVKS